MSLGRIYFIQAEIGGPIKIGFATDVWARLKGLQTGHPEKLVCRVHICGTMEDEHVLHEDYTAHRLVGEWFSDCAEIRELLDRAKAHITAEIPGEKPKPIPRPARTPKEAVFAGIDGEMFARMAEQAFGRAGLARKLSQAAGVCQKAAENWLGQKCDPQFDSLTRLLRNNDVMHLWFMGTIVAGALADEFGCDKRRAWACIGKCPEYVTGIYLSQTKERFSAGLRALWSIVDGPANADCLKYLDDFCAESIEMQRQRAAA